jgi:predicted RNA-binding Zn-ribbon protein involved in translation (DUF1610 family)
MSGLPDPPVCSRCGREMRLAEVAPSRFECSNCDLRLASQRLPSMWDLPFSSLDSE